MTKEEKIKEAWGKLMPDYTSIDLVNGWSLGTFLPEKVDFSLFDTVGTKIGYFIRPKSLQGIEDNNGWIKIESEDDLPKEGDLFWVMKKGYNYPLFEPMYHDDGEYWLQWYTHYQPILKPKPPIY